METGFRKIVYLLVLLSALISCEKFEFRGFFISYESVDERFGQSMDWNAENPFREISVSVDDYSIFVMGDCHAGGTYNLGLFLEEAIRMDAIAAVMAGDLTNGHPEDYGNFKQHLPPVDSLLLFQMVGNHDLFFDGWKQFYSLFGSTTYIFTVKTPQAADLYVCLDTGGGTLGSRQLEWLKDILKTERPDYRHCVLFTHNNLFRIRHTSSTNPFVEELQVLTELCIEHHIDMVVAGHDHLKNDVVFGNTTHITLDALKDGFKDAGYMKLFIKQHEIGFAFVNF